MVAVPAVSRFCPRLCVKNARTWVGNEEELFICVDFVRTAIVLPQQRQVVHNEKEACPRVLSTIKSLYPPEFLTKILLLDLIA